ncbi:DUF4097 domain-containing protein, partial [bacterium]|nr:DUF4097 domain-containing protein [bacterium]
MKAINLFFIVLITLVMLVPASDCQAKKKKDIFNLDETYSLDKDGTIFLTTEDADVKIVGSDRDDVHLVVRYEAYWSGVFLSSKYQEFEMDVTSENGDLHIREFGADHTITAGIVNHSDELYTIDLEVPMGASLRIRGDDDDYDISDIMGQINLSFEDGDARLTGCHGDAFEFDFEDGEVELRGGKGKLEAYCEDGAIIISEGDFSEMYAEVEDGDIDIATKLASDGNYEFRCEDGDIDFEVIAGGGEFRITYEDGHVRAS